MPSAIDDPTCHECVIACAIRAERNTLRAEVAMLTTEVARLTRLLAHRGERYTRRGATP